MPEFLVRGFGAWRNRVTKSGARRSAPPKRARAALAFALAAGIGACQPAGPRQIRVDRFDYNSAIAASSNEQMLLNLVRLRYGEVPVFLAVNSVLTQYVWTGEVGVTAAGGENLSFPAWSVGGVANYRYVERPTVTYTPLVGQEFAAQLITPVRADLVFSLVSSGWPPDQLLAMTVQRFNEVENVGFAWATGDAPAASGEFARFIELIIELARRDAIELTRAPAPAEDESNLQFAPSVDPDTQARIDELKTIAGLDPGLSRFRVTRKIVGRAPDEVTIRMHSLVELMGLLSMGVQSPPEEPEAQSSEALPAGGEGESPLRVHCSADRPEHPFVAVQYDGHWYWVSRSDEESKRAFGLLIYLFQMQATQAQGAGPLLTVPVN